MGLDKTENLGSTKQPLTATTEGTTRLDPPEQQHAGDAGTVCQNESDKQAAVLDSMGQGRSKAPPLVPEGYRIIELLGAGTFGEVWRGVNEVTKVQVAI